MQSPIPGVPTALAWALLAFTACVVIFHGVSFVRGAIGALKGLGRRRAPPPRPTSVASILKDS